MSRGQGRKVKTDLLVYTCFGLVCLIRAVGVAKTLGASFGLGTEKATYSAIFSSASGLENSDEVRIAGLPVGKVQEVELHDNDQARVIFTVPASRSLPSSTIVEVKYDSVIGARILSLRPGSSGSGVSDRLEPGATIPTSQTRSALSLDTLLAGFEPLFKGLPADQVNKLMTNIVSVLQGQGGTVESLLTHTASLTNTIADRDRVIDRVIDNLNAVLGNLDAHSGRLSGTLQKLQQLVSGLSQNRKRLGNSLDTVNTLVTSVDRLVTRVRGPLKGSVDQLDRVATEVNKKGNDLDRILKTLPGAYLRLGRLASRGSYYNLGLCAVRLKLTGPDGRPVYTPWVGPNEQVERCQFNSSPLETPAERKRKGK